MTTKRERALRAMYKKAMKTWLYFYSAYKGRRDSGEDETEEIEQK